MSYTLQEMLQNEPFSELEVMAGKEGLDNLVRYVGVLEAPDSVNFVKEQEFVLTTGYVFGTQAERLPDIVRQLCARHAAALGIKMFRYVQALPEEVRKLADEGRLPIFFVPNHFSWHELILPMILNISARNAGEQAFYRNYDQLIYGMQHAQTIYDSVSRAGELLQKPLTLLNINTLEQLCYPAGEPLPGEPEVWRQILSAPKAGVLQDGKIRYYGPEGERQAFLAARLQIPEYQYLILYGSPEPGDFNYFNYLVYSLMLVAESLQNRREDRKNRILQQSLALKRFFSEKEKMRAAECPLEAGHRYAPLLASFSGENVVMGERISLFNPVVLRLMELMNQKWRICGFADDAGYLHFFLPGEKKDGLAEERRIGAGISRILEKYFPDLTARVLLGRWGNNAEEVWQRHEELFLAAACLKRQKEGKASLLHVCDLGLGVVLERPEVRRVMTDFLQEYFDPLTEREPEEQERLLDTVRAYTSSGFCTREAARFLGVHHNTVRNRLEQLSGLTGLDFRQPQDLLILLTYMQLSH